MFVNKFIPIGALNKVAAAEETEAERAARAHKEAVAKAEALKWQLRLRQAGNSIGKINYRGYDPALVHRVRHAVLSGEFGSDYNKDLSKTFHRANTAGPKGSAAFGVWQGTPTARLQWMTENAQARKTYGAYVRDVLAPMQSSFLQNGRNMGAEGYNPLMDYANPHAAYSSRPELKTAIQKYIKQGVKFGHGYKHTPEMAAHYYNMGLQYMVDQMHKHKIDPTKVADLRRFGTIYHGNVDKQKQEAYNDRLVRNYKALGDAAAPDIVLGTDYAKDRPVVDKTVTFGAPNIRNAYNKFIKLLNSGE